MYPAEYVVRIFKGKYPRLSFSENSFQNKKILDISCGDGRHLIFLHSLGFEVYGTEITEDIVEKVKGNLSKWSISGDVRVGTNDNLPFKDNFFDYMLSWNVCYYMRETKNLHFEKHVEEYSRVLKNDGFLILSIPKKTSFIYKNSIEVAPGYRRIRDYFGIRTGTVLKVFESLQEIIDYFSPYFKDFVVADIHDDCFGLNYHWYIIVCKKK
jgi:SAM-dependent methyltransferase